MKKLLVLILLALILTGCLSGYTFNYEEHKETVILVKIIEIISPFDTQVIETIDDKNEIDLFLKDFSKIKYRKLIGDPVSLNGLCIQINFENGNYKVFSKRTIRKFKSDGEEILMLNQYCSKDIFNKIVGKHFNLEPSI